MALVALNYLECRGRAQALRAQLADAGISFTDARASIEDLKASWAGIADDPTQVGPFKALPVLAWNGFQLAQTLPIANYLDAQLGGSEGRSPQELARQQMLTSAAHLDVTVPIGLFVWQPILHPHSPLRPSFLALATRVGTKLRQLNAAWPKDTVFAGGPTPCSADYATYEALAGAQLVLGHGVRQAIEGCDRLSELRRALLSRPKFRECDERAPRQLAASPKEMQVRAEIARWGEDGS